MEVLKKIQRFETEEQPRRNKLQRYYLGENDINRVVKAEGKPNHKISNNYPKNIVNTTVGYFMGKPVAYDTEDEDLKIAMEEITAYNDDDAHNLAIATDLSKFGIAYELLWVDEDKKVRYTKLDPRTAFVVRKNDIEHTIECGIYFYDVEDDDKNVTRYVDVYDEAYATHYVVQNGGLVMLEQAPHYFGDVPINVYINNEETQGDYENVISKIDAYDTMQSETVNDFCVFADAYLFISGMRLTDEDIQRMRENRVINGEGSAQWLTKQVNDTYIENMKTRLDTDIYKLSNTVNMSDKEFAGNLSGVAMQYKFMNMETRIAVTERNFTKALQRRFELICNYLNMLGASYDFASIKFTFTRNLPQNLLDTATLAQQLQGIASTRTILKLFPFIDDVDAELKELENESGNYPEMGADEDIEE